MDKKQLRKKMQANLKAMDERQRQANNEAIRKTVLDSSIWKDHHCIGITVSTPMEIDTHPLIQAAWDQAKRVGVPKCEPQTKTLHFYSLAAFGQLERVFYGLQEPVVSQTVPLEPHEIELLVVPGLCFDLNGYRVGFGGGYYDRFLTQYKGIKIALAYEEQLVTDIPIESHDIPVDYIFTPDRVINCHNRRG